MKVIECVYEVWWKLRVTGGGESHGSNEEVSCSGVTFEIVGLRRREKK
jgi:hypothetical protein